MSFPTAHGDAHAATGAAPGVRVSPYAVKLPIFEGPLDLLLHLIRVNEVEVTDIPIARVGEQYLEYLELMLELDLDLAGEYLVMAATLAWIKSRMLLPPDGIDEEAEGPDPRAELIARLLEYQRFKEAAAEIDERERLGRDVFTGCGPRAEPLPESEREIEVGLFELIEAFRRALRAAGPNDAPHEIHSETITVHERMLAVMKALEGREFALFGEVIAAGAKRSPSRALLVATFLAILELARIAALRIYQAASEHGVPEGPIRLRAAPEEGRLSWMDRIADIM